MSDKTPGVGWRSRDGIHWRPPTRRERANDWLERHPTYHAVTVVALAFITGLSIVSMLPL